MMLSTQHSALLSRFGSQKTETTSPKSPALVQKPSRLVHRSMGLDLHFDERPFLCSSAAFLSKSMVPAFTHLHSHEMKS